MKSNPLDALIQANLAEDRPSSLSLDLTDACNLSCTHCIRVLNGRFMDSDLARMLIREAAEMGVFRMGINGGEPTYHPDFLSLTEYALKHGMTVNVNTNGTLHHSTILDLYRRWKAFTVKISLYGYDDPSSASITGVPGTFSRTMKLLEALASEGFWPRVVIMVRKDTADHLPDLADKLRSMGLDRLEFIYRIERREDGDPAPLAFKATDEQILRIMRIEGASAFSYTPELEDGSTGGMACAAGIMGLDVGVDGTIRPCVMLPVTLGTYRKIGDLRRAWKGDKRRNFLKLGMISLPKVCRSCSVLHSCSYCPASSYRFLARPAVPAPQICRETVLKARISRELSFKTDL